MQNVPKNFTCPICFEVPYGPVYQCSNGHIICDYCVKKTTNCPQCRVVIRVNGDSLVRNRAVEEYLMTCTVPCLFKKRGCLSSFYKPDLEDHIQTCKFNPRNAPVCRRLGLECDQYFNESCMSTALIFQHVKKCHDISVHELTPEKSNIFLRINSFASALKKLSKLNNKLGDEKCEYEFLPEVVWPPQVFYLNKMYFLIATRLDRADNTLSLTCYGTTSKHCLHTKFLISSKRKESEHLEWSIPVKSVFEPKYLWKSPIKIPIEVLERDYIDAGTGTLDIVVFVIGIHSAIFQPGLYRSGHHVITINDHIPYKLKRKNPWGDFAAFCFLIILSIVGSVLLFKPPSSGQDEGETS